MAYDSTGLRRMFSGVVNMHVLYTTDTIAAATAANYISDATTTDVLPGKGMAFADPILIVQVTAIPPTGEAAADCLDQAWSFVSGLNTTTGAGSLTAT